MARLSTGLALASLPARLQWAVRRAARMLLRRIGALGLVMLLCIAAAMAAWLVQQRGERALAVLAVGQAERALAPVPRRMAEVEDDDARMAAFQAYLLPQEDIPVVVQDLIAAAADQKLLMPRGDYKVHPEPQAGFMRYRMTLPVKGEAQAVQAFMIAALKANKTLALEAVQYKRDLIVSTVVEARIQWVLLTRLPAQEKRS